MKKYMCGYFGKKMLMQLYKYMIMRIKFSSYILKAL